MCPSDVHSSSIPKGLPGGFSFRGKKGETQGGQGKEFRLSEVAEHSVPGDCWVIVKNKVYDVSTFAKTHPGGDVIYTYGGRDATDVFSVFHSVETWSRLKQFYVGEYIQEEAVPEVVRDFRTLRSEMVRLHFFDSNKLFYAYKVSTTLGLLFGSWLILSLFSSYTLALYVSAALLGLFYQQMGWVSHDFLHHQVFKWRPLNHFWGGPIIGALFTGLSPDWWVEKHSTHHAAPNECDDAYHAVDPDIDTLPFLAWSDGMLKNVESPSIKAALRWQRELFFPLLLFARFAWVNSSLQWVAQRPSRSQRWTLGVPLVLHHFLVLAIGCSVLPLGPAIGWKLMGDVWGGLLLGFVFVQSHNGMEVTNHNRRDFFSAQIATTRNIRSGLFNDWFCGGLNYQIEHHLFPTLPRHRLKAVAARVRAICEKNSLVYEDVGFLAGTRSVLNRLAEVAALA
eukprot:TRINITY_DN22928_c0_g1_i1.p1 TRINITY_DN22928_c0_g1~~TRINITY_DN22928_c0_g1_i1.p1  ORF type:complete len:451 (-),score=73.08 TRINITY_DN22928_c0_g1_i1:1145-2497(-)